MNEPIFKNQPTAEEIAALKADGQKVGDKAIVGSVIIQPANGEAAEMLFLEDGSKVIRDGDGKKLQKWPEIEYPVQEAADGE